jgi:hypothetical protein
MRQSQLRYYVSSLSMELFQVPAVWLRPCVWVWRLSVPRLLVLIWRQQYKDDISWRLLRAVKDDLHFYDSWEKRLFFLVRSEVLTAVGMAMMFLWAVTLRRFVGTYQRFGGTHCLHLQHWSQHVSAKRYCVHTSVHCVTPRDIIIPTAVRTSNLIYFCV